jgi:hypothetical protein
VQTPLAVAETRGRNKARDKAENIFRENMVVISTL